MFWWKYPIEILIIISVYFRKTALYYKLDMLDIVNWSYLSILCVLQDFTENMESHRDNKNYLKWNLENTAGVLHSYFPDCHVVIVRPARWEYLINRPYNNNCTHDYLSLIVYMFFFSFLYTNLFIYYTYSLFYALKYKRKFCSNICKYYKQVFLFKLNIFYKI